MKPDADTRPEPAGDAIGPVPDVELPVPAVATYPQLHSVNKALGPLTRCLLAGRMRYGFFLGAGCSASVMGPDGKSLIAPVAPLTKLVLEKLEENHAEARNAILSLCNGNGKTNPNIEDVLSQVRGTAAILGSAKIGELDKGKLDELDQQICKLVVAEVSKDLPDEITPFDELAHWIPAVDRPYPVELFTPNYDLLIEQAMERRRVPYYDGFVGNRNAFFDLDGIERDTLPPHWARLWKVHGSINWRQDANGAAVRVASPDEGAGRYLIYPSHLKYDESRKMPYLVLFDRLRYFLRQQAVLFILGYSFSDQHLNEVIIEGLSSNPHAMCFALMYLNLADHKDAVAAAKRCPNLTVIAADGACISRKPGTWVAEERAALFGPTIQIETEKGEDKNAEPTVVPKCTAGDFAQFSKFLMDHLPAHAEEELRQ